MGIYNGLLGPHICPPICHTVMAALTCAPGPMFSQQLCYCAVRDSLKIIIYLLQNHLPLSTQL